MKYVTGQSRYRCYHPSWDKITRRQRELLEYLTISRMDVPINSSTSSWSESRSRLHFTKLRCSRWLRFDSDSDFVLIVRSLELTVDEVTLKLSTSFHGYRFTDTCIDPHCCVAWVRSGILYGTKLTHLNRKLIRTRLVEIILGRGRSDAWFRNMESLWQDSTTQKYHSIHVHHLRSEFDENGFVPILSATDVVRNIFRRSLDISFFIFSPKATRCIFFPSFPPCHRASGPGGDLFFWPNLLKLIYNVSQRNNFFLHILIARFIHGQVISGTVLHRLPCLCKLGLIHDKASVKWLHII